MHPLEETFRILRVRVERQAALPAIIVVSAAKRQDGATFVACGLARAFAESGKQTLLVDANASFPGVARALGSPGGRVGDLVPRSDEIPRLTVSTLVGPTDDGSFREGALKGVLDEMRSAYNVTIFDTAPLPHSSIALQLAHAADGLLLAVRMGRKTDAADGEVKRLLDKETTRLLGIVPTQARATRGGRVAVSPTLKDRAAAAKRGIGSSWR